MYILIHIHVYVCIIVSLLIKKFNCCRRQEIQKKLRPNEKLFTLTAFPRLVNLIEAFKNLFKCLILIFERNKFAYNNYFK